MISTLELNQTERIQSSQLTPQENLELMQDSTPDLNRVFLLRKRLWQNGYLYFKNFYQRAIVTSGEKEVRQRLSTLQSKKNHDVQHTKIDSTSILFQEDTTNHMFYVSQIFNAKKNFELFHQLLDTPVAALSNKQLRVMQMNGYTDIHADSFYIGESHQKVYTAWASLSEIPFGQGGLVLYKKSHLFETLSESDQKKCLQHHAMESIAKDNSCSWVTAHFQTGDLVIFGLHTLHGLMPNATPSSQISCTAYFQTIDEKIEVLANV